MDFQDAKSSATTCSYKPPDMQYMGRKLKMCFRLEDTGKTQWFDGQILNYDLPQVSMVFIFHLIIRLFTNDKDVALINLSTTRYVYVILLSY